jgi:hypothetical protein
MARIYTMPFNLREDTWVGIFLEPWMQFGEHVGWHAGIVFQDNGETPVWMDLKNSLEPLRRNRIPSRGWYLDLELDPLQAIAVIDKFRLILINSDRLVWYGFSDFKRQWFDEDGRFVHEASGEGLTCASFVIAMFKAGGIDLVDNATWPERPGEDNAPKQKYIDTINQHYSTLPNDQKRHFDDLCRLQPSPRCLLRELFGAASVPQARLQRGPVHFGQAARRGANFAGCVQSEFPSGPEF